MENLYCSFVEFMYSLPAVNAMHEAPSAAITPAAAHTVRPSVAQTALNQLRTHTAGLAEVAHLDW